MPNEPRERANQQRETTTLISKQSLAQTEALVRARVSVDQIRRSRLITQNAIGRSRASLAETRAALVAMKLALSTALRRKVQRRIDALRPPS